MYVCSQSYTFQYHFGFSPGRKRSIRTKSVPFEIHMAAISQPWNRWVAFPAFNFPQYLHNHSLHKVGMLFFLRLSCLGQEGQNLVSSLISLHNCSQQILAPHLFLRNNVFPATNQDYYSFGGCPRKGRPRKRLWELPKQCSANFVSEISSLWRGWGACVVFLSFCWAWRCKSQGPIETRQRMGWPASEGGVVNGKQSLENRWDEGSGVSPALLLEIGWRFIRIYSMLHPTTHRSCRIPTEHEPMLGDLLPTSVSLLPLLLFYPPPTPRNHPINISTSINTKKEYQPKNGLINLVSQICPTTQFLDFSPAVTLIRIPSHSTNVRGIPILDPGFAVPGTPGPSCAPHYCCRLRSGCAYLQHPLRWHPVPHLED